MSQEHTERTYCPNCGSDITGTEDRTGRLWCQRCRRIISRHADQVKRAYTAGLSIATIESVRQGCYSDTQLAELIERRKRS